MSSTNTSRSNNRTKNTQSENIVNHLRKGKALTVTEARSRYGIEKLSSRISELRDAGFKINTTKKKTKSGVVTAYTL